MTKFYIGLIVIKGDVYIRKIWKICKSLDMKSISETFTTFSHVIHFREFRGYQINAKLSSCKLGSLHQAYFTKNSHLQKGQNRKTARFYSCEYLMSVISSNDD